MLCNGDSIGANRIGDFERPVKIDPFMLSGGRIVRPVETAVGDGEKIGADSLGIQASDEEERFFDG